MLMPPSNLIFLTSELHNCQSLWDTAAKPPEVLLSVNKCRIIIHCHRGPYMYSLCHNCIIKFGVIKKNGSREKSTVSQPSFIEDLPISTVLGVQ